MNFSRFPRTMLFDSLRTPAAPPTEEGGPSNQQAADGPRAAASLPRNVAAFSARPRNGQPRKDGNEPPPSPSGPAGENAQDSITLGQLKAHNQTVAAKQKTQLFDFRYDDSDTIMNELEEFYAYIDMAHIAKNVVLFKAAFDGEWTETPASRRKAFIEVQLELLESPTRTTRREAQGRLLYLLQGCFAETTSPEMQLHWIIENAKIVRSVDGVPSLVQTLIDASKRYHSTVDRSGGKPVSTGSANSVNGGLNSEQYDDHSAELLEVLAILYIVVEVFRSDETFGDELMATTPPLPTTIFHMLVPLKDYHPKGYPTKKVMLLLWKSIIACLGGMKEVAKAKALSRELANLGPEPQNFTKASPMDITNFRRDTSVKYPTFAPPASVSISVSNEKLAEGIKPIPARPNYHSTEIPTASGSKLHDPRASTPAPPAPATPAPQPGTPAPTPPASPNAKPKKQQFQTDPTKPFVFPYSRITTGEPGSLVPYAIAEADRLYHRHAYVSLGLYQMWDVREELIRDERGLGKNGLIGFSDLRLDDDDEEDEAAMEAMRTDWKYEEQEQDCSARGDREGARIARDKRSAAKRLHRVEAIYKALLPIMQPCVIVILKMLLNTISPLGQSQQQQLQLHQQQQQQQQQAQGQPGAGPPDASPVQEMPPVDERPKTREDIELIRHREIVSKAGTGILILLLKWFRASHVLKFHHLATMLFDSNGMLLVLKIFGLHDVARSVMTKYEDEDLTFFRYCHLNFSKHPPPDDRPEDTMLRQPRPAPTPAEGDTEVELITDYSWRNFFSSINFLKILQKMTKHRTHRTHMLQSYKATAIFKRMIRVNHPMLQLQALKLIKSQMPWCGRKWRQTNMKVITAIYLNCRPDLRDEWLSGQDVETELEDSAPQELALRTLTQFYNKRHYAAYLAPQASPDFQHKRTSSTSAVTFDDEGLLSSGQPPGLRPGLPRTSSAGENDVFPPRRFNGVSSGDEYNPEDMTEFWELEYRNLLYDDVVAEVFGDRVISQEDRWDDTDADAREVDIGPNGQAWNKLSEIMRANGRWGDEDEISDSESVVSVGELGDDARLPGADLDLRGRDVDEDDTEAASLARMERRKSGNENTWEHMSPNTLSLLPRSPAERRRSSSSGSPLRPVGLPRSILDIGGGAVFDDEEDGGELPGPMPIKKDTDDEREREYGAVDEVEYAYGE